MDGLFTGQTISDLQNGSPLSKSESLSIEIRGHLSQRVKTHCGSLIIGSRNYLKTLIDLNSGNYSSLEEQLREEKTVIGLLSCLFRVEDDSTNVLFKIRGSEQQLSVQSSVLCGVLNIDRLELLSDCSFGLISCQNTFSWGADSLGGLC